MFWQFTAELKSPDALADNATDVIKQSIAETPAGFKQTLPATEVNVVANSTSAVAPIVVQATLAGAPPVVVQATAATGASMPVQASFSSGGPVIVMAKASVVVAPVVVQAYAPRAVAPVVVEAASVVVQARAVATVPVVSQGVFAAACTLYEDAEAKRRSMAEGAGTRTITKAGSIRY